LLTWSTFRAQVPQNDNSLLPLLDAAALHGLDEAVLVVKRSAFAGESKTLLAGDLGDGTTWSKVTLEYTVNSVTVQ
jgi:hypothetical protein